MNELPWPFPSPIVIEQRVHSALPAELEKANGSIRARIAGQLYSWKEHGHAWFTRPIRRAWWRLVTGLRD
jgi:hypothetical protein